MYMCVCVWYFEWLSYGERRRNLCLECGKERGVREKTNIERLCGKMKVGIRDRRMKRKRERYNMYIKKLRGENKDDQYHCVNGII